MTTIITIHYTEKSINTNIIADMNHDNITLTQENIVQIRSRLRQFQDKPHLQAEKPKGLLQELSTSSKGCKPKIMRGYR
ncbi:hypothetical protein C1645_780116 [Glomus cerebriforme]|uniref:Uncharacterized protein n=1 Tax=Glomus cerebriforme TaxID=658196 RepID=A0A397SJJ6_9GLOM|nr:hypothetical protein C1645_780116 [Glomus cerebriforme]